jgi:hypothetical protein
MTLAEYIQSNLKTPFNWGFFDCATFSATWVRTCTGVDLLDGVTPWQTEREARRVMKATGGVAAWIDRSFPAVHPNFANDGDIGIYEQSVGIFTGAHIVCPGPDGLIFTDRTKAQCAWSIS